MTKNRKITQMTLIFVGLFLIMATYFLYPKISEKKYEDVSSDDNNMVTEGDESSLFKNVEYQGLYGENSPFNIKAKDAYVLNENPLLIHMNDMHVTLYTNDGRVIIIKSDTGRYNKATYDCYFENNVNATDGETLILADNLDLLATSDSASVYNNVVLTNDKGSLRADKVDYNFETKFYKISMFNNKKVKVKFIK